MGILYTNSDGLQQHYGTRAVSQGAGEKTGTAFTKTITLDFDGVGLVDTTPIIDRSQARLPKGAYIKSVTLLVENAFTSGGAATLDVGTFKASDGTVLDIDGFIAASAVAGLTAGADIADAGAQVGTIIAEDTYIVPTYNTAVFTAGKGRLVVEYQMSIE